MKRVQEDIDSDGYKFIYIYDDKYLQERLSYRPDGSLMDRVVYTWELEVSQYDPVSWKEYDRDSNLRRTAVSVDFDSRGIYKEQIFYRADGTEEFRKPRSGTTGT